MATPSKKSPEIERVADDISNKLFGRARTESIKSDICTACGKEATNFRNEVSKREYTISGLCQQCQDEIFGK